MFANLIDFEITERFNWPSRLVKRSPASCPKSQERAGLAQIWQQTGRDQPEPSRRAVPYLVIALFNFLFVGWPLAVQAQVSNPGSWTRTQQSTVSVRELQIPAKSRSAFLRGFERLVKGDAAGSLEHFRRAIQEFPGFYEAYYNKGVAETQLHQKDEALQSFQKAIDLSGGHCAGAYFGYSFVLAQQGRPKDAELIVRRGFEEDPSSSDGYSVLAFVLFGQNRLDEAEAAAHKALLLPHHSPRSALLTLAYIHLGRGEYRLAVQDLEAYLKAVRSTPRKDDTEHNQYIRNLLNEAKAKSVEQIPEGAS
jgi:tetratricopeptide (TPR) repeat protein